MKKLLPVLIASLISSAAHASIIYTFWDGTQNLHGTGNLPVQGIVSNNGVDTVTETLAFGSASLELTGVSQLGFQAVSTNLGGTLPSVASTEHATILRRGDNPEVIRLQNSSVGDHTRTFNGVVLWDAATSGQSALFNEIAVDFDVWLGSGTGSFHAVVTSGGNTYVSVASITPPSATTTPSNLVVDATLSDWQLWDFTTGFDVVFSTPVAADNASVSAVGIYFDGSGFGTASSTFVNGNITRFATMAAVPEPSVYAAALALGLFGIVLLRRRK